MNSTCIKKWKVILSIIACLLLAVVWLWSPIPESIKQAQKNTLVMEKLAIKQQVKKLEAAQQVGDAAAEQQATSELIKLLPKKLAGTFFMARNMLVDIEFYGRVVDQNGMPVEDAQVQIGVSGGGALAPGSGSGIINTDEDGVFRLDAKGQRFSVSIRHPEISTLAMRSVNGAITQEPYFDPYKNDQSVGVGWTDHSDRKNPYIFKVWREAGFGNVFSSGGMDGGVKVDDGFYTYMENPNQSKKFWWIKEKGINPKGYVAIKCIRDSDVHDSSAPPHRQYGSWSITIAPIDGGIQPASVNDVYLNRAPESGYQPSISVGRQASNPDYAHMLSNQTYYFTAQNGKVYGSMRITFEPFWSEDSCIASIKRKYTTDGSRNLAVKGKF
ncbi:MAG: hypothetical protein KBT53_09800 [Porticoccus sp.]|nr:hypothetical protein [Porticoccus sp.]